MINRSIIAWIFIFSTSILINACSNSQGQNTPTTPRNQLQDVTDKRTCLGPPGPDASIFNTWHLQFAGTLFNVHETFEISPQSTMITKTCIFPSGMSVPVSTTVASVVQGSQYSIYTSGQNSVTEVDAKGVQFTCSVNVDPENVAFAFVGNCLALAQSGQITYLIP